LRLLPHVSEIQDVTLADSCVCLDGWVFRSRAAATRDANAFAITNAKGITNSENARHARDADAFSDSYSANASKHADAFGVAHCFAATDEHADAGRKSFAKSDGSNARNEHAWDEDGRDDHRATARNERR
jgi:hypothetical protein